MTQDNSDNNSLILNAFRRVFIDVQTGKSDSSITSLLQSGTPADIDFSALNVFLRTGFYIGNSTPFSYIRTSLPDIPQIKTSTLNQTQAIEAYADLFRQAMRRCIARHDGEPFTMGLTGGRDSRHILLEALALGKPPALCWTVDAPETPDDTTIAAALASRYRVTHKIIPAPTHIRAEYEKNRITNFCSFQHGWMWAVRGLTRFAHHVYDGIGGDVLSESSIVQPQLIKMIESGRYDEFVETVVNKEPLALLKQNDAFPSRTDALERVYTELTRHLHTVNPAVSFFFWNRTRRDVGEATFSSLSNYGLTAHAPFLDKDMFYFLSSLPAEITTGTHFHTACIEVTYRHAENIRYAAKSPVAFVSSPKVFLTTLRYLWQSEKVLLDRKEAVTKMVLSIISSKYRSNAGWIIPRSLYLSQLAAPLREWPLGRE